MLELFTSHLYLGLSAYLFVAALLALALRPDLWRPFLFMAVVGILLAPVHNSISLQDWFYPKFLFGWRPAFLGGLPFPPEDAMFGAGVTGLSALLYPLVFRQQLVAGTHRPMPLSWQAAGVLISITLLLAPFYLWGMHSFYTSALGCGYLAYCVGYQRPDLLRPMAFTAITLTLIASLYYPAALLINPHWLEQEWFLNKFSGIMLGRVPIEELVWYVYAGFVFAGLYPCRIGASFAPVQARHPSLPRELQIIHTLTPARTYHAPRPLPQLAGITLPSAFRETLSH